MADTPKRKRGRNGQFVSGGIRVRGFFRLNLVEHDKDTGAPRIVGDTGWVENTITTVGKNQYLAMALGGVAGSKSVARMAIGAGTEPATTATSLESEFADMTGASSTRNRATVSTSTGGANTATIQFAATWASATQFVTTTHPLKNIGLYHNTDNAGSLFAGTTFTQSTLNTNQDVQASYVISFQ
jgi:hypothetical protein